MGIGRADDGLAPTPPMGWNSWNRFQTRIDETLVREHAEAIVATGMRDLGYRYVVIDDGWEAPARDGHGDLAADPDRFPHGIAALADAVHALGLRFGIYTDAGTKTCAGNVGSLGYEFRDAKHFAEWGVDFVKIDWCHTEGLGARAVYAKWALALAAAGRPMIHSICEWGRHHPWEWAAPLGHMWRTCWDIVDTWQSFTAVLDRQADLHPYSGPGHWNDPDMLEVGNGGMTDEEYRAHFSLWAILAAPLMAGNDVRAMSEPTRATLAAREVIALDQDPLGRQGRRLRQDGGLELWVREVSDGLAVAFHDRSDTAREIAAGREELGVARGRPVVARDLWERADIGRLGDALVARVPAHGVRLFRLRYLD